jgi:hypothetical protein
MGLKWRKSARSNANGGDCVEVALICGPSRPLDGAAPAGTAGTATR